MGSKTRIVKDILPIMLKHRRKDDVWVEPFVGGGNMIAHVDGDRIGSDYNIHSINALIMIRDFLNDIPKTAKEFDKDDYIEMKNRYKNGETSPLMGYIGFTLSFGSILFDSWATNTKDRDYVKQAYNSAVKQSGGLKDVKLIHCSYDELEIPKNSVIYCDPPYSGTRKYKGVPKFDSYKFWGWCREKSKTHIVFITEFNAPDDFVCVWNKEHISSLDSKNGSITAVEKLFIHESLKHLVLDEIDDDVLNFISL